MKAFIISLIAVMGAYVLPLAHAQTQNSPVGDEEDHKLNAGQLSLKIALIGELFQNFDNLFFRTQNACRNEKCEDLQDENAEKVFSKYKELKSKLLHYATAAVRPEHRRLASLILLGNLRQLADPDVRKLSKELILKNFSHCGGFDDCLELIFNLAELAPVAPELIGSVEFEKRITEDFKKAGNIFLTELLKYRFESLTTLLSFYTATNLHEWSTLGNLPKISAEDQQNIRNRLQRLTGEKSFFAKAKASKESILTYLILHKRGINAHLEGTTPGQTAIAKAALKTLDKNIQNRMQAVANDLFAALMRNHYANLSLNLYLNRLNYPSTKAWLFTIKADNNLDRLVAFLTLQRFATIEFALPYREEWFNMTKELAAKIDRKQYEHYDYDALLKINEEQLTWYRGQVRDFVTRQKLTMFEDEEEVSLEKKEQWAARNFSSFHSLIQQQRIIETALYNIHPQLNAFKEEGNIKAKERLGDRLVEGIDSVMQKYLSTACYGYWIPKPDSEFFLNSKLEQLTQKDIDAKERSQKIAISPLSSDNSDTYDLTKICGYEKSRGVQLSVGEYLYKQDLKDAYKKFVMEVGKIPLIIGSAKLSGYVQQPVHAWTKKWFARAATRMGSETLTRTARAYLVRKAFYYSMQNAFPGAISSWTGAAIFSFTQRSALAAATQSLTPYYNPNMSFWGNYGGDLVMGTAIFMFVPYVQTGMIRLSAGRFGLPAKTEEIMERFMMRQLTPLQEGLVVGSKIAADTVVFTASPYAGRALGRLFGEKPHIWQGIETLEEELKEAAQMGTIFRGTEYYGNARFRKEVAKEYKEKTDPQKLYETLGVTREADFNEIRTAYNKLMLRYDPDRNFGQEVLAKSKLGEIHDAYKILSNPNLRAKYDALLNWSKGDNLASWGDNRSVRQDLSDIVSALMRFWDRGGKKGVRDLPALPPPPGNVPLLPDKSSGTK